MTIEQQYVLDALDRRKGDDLERALHAFKNCTPAEMAGLYGQSGFTRQQILDQYQSDRELWKRAMGWLRKEVGT